MNYVVGYMVSLEGFEKKVSIEKETEIKSFIKLYSSLAKANQVNIGAWYNEVDGQVYFDLSERVYDRAEAIKLALERKQLAIYDCKNKGVINV